jgi:uncharacterized membrane protein
MTRQARVRLLATLWIVGLSAAGGAVFGFLIATNPWIGHALGLAGRDSVPARPAVA